MAAAAPQRSGGCSCGQVRYAVDGRADPRRPLPLHLLPPGKRQHVHCLRDLAAIGVRTRPASSSTWEGRSFCPVCGSRLFAVSDEAVEVKLGTLEDAPTNLMPQYELWVWRREHWLDPLEGARQFERDRDPDWSPRG